MKKIKNLELVFNAEAREIADKETLSWVLMLNYEETLKQT